MVVKPSRAVETQRKYYTDTAARYDSMHAHEGAMDTSITKFVHAFLRMLEARSVLDVGTATGRGMCDLKRALPDLVSRWADRVILIPSTPAENSSWFHPLLNSRGVLVFALKEHS